jgi:hypothetical protein
MAFNISIVTSTDRAMVIGCGSSKTSQSISAHSLPPPAHWKWWVFNDLILKKCIRIRNSFIIFLKNKRGLIKVKTRKLSKIMHQKTNKVQNKKLNFQSFKTVYLSLSL